MYEISVNINGYTMEGVKGEEDHYLSIGGLSFYISSYGVTLLHNDSPLYLKEGITNIQVSVVNVTRWSEEVAWGQVGL